jgi:hypothetical protein
LVQHLLEHLLVLWHPHHLLVLMDLQHLEHLDDP